MFLSNDFQPAKLVSLSSMTFFKMILIFVGVGFLWFIRDILALLFVALLLSALIDPVADWAATKRIPRGLTVIGVYVCIGGILLILLGLLVPAVLRESQLLLSSSSTMYERFTASVQQVTDYTIAHGWDDEVSSAFKSLQSSVSEGASSVFSTVRGIFGWVAALILVLVLTFYLVVEEDAARRYFQQLAPPEYRPYLSQLLSRMQKKIGAWMRGQLFLGFIIGSLVFIGLVVLGVENALLLGLLAGFFEMIPYIGPVLSLIPALLVASAQSPVHGLLVLILYIVIQQLENHLIVPKVMQQATGLNPVVSIIAFLIGAKIGGPVGAVLAIPVMTMVAVLLDDLFATHPTSDSSRL